MVQNYNTELSSLSNKSWRLEYIVPPFTLVLYKTSRQYSRLEKGGYPKMKAKDESKRSVRPTMIPSGINLVYSKDLTALTC